MANNISAVTINQLPSKSLNGSDAIITGSGSLLYRSSVNSLQNRFREVFEFDTVSNFPSTGKSSALYIDESSNILYRWNGSGYVQVSGSLGYIDIANASGVSQFPVGLGDQLRIQGSGDTSISFNGTTNTINIHSTPGSGGGSGAVTSFNGRDGAVVSQAGDYSTAMVNENTNLYFTEPRVRSTPLTGLAVSNTPISSTNTLIQALGRLQGQINNRITGSYTGFDSRYVNVGGDTMTGELRVTPNVTSGATTQAKTIQLGSTSNGAFLSSANNAGGSVSYVLRGYQSNGVQLTLNEGAVSAKGQIAIRAIGTDVGTLNTARVGFFESNGTVEQGYVGFASNTRSDINIRNFIADTYLQLREEGGINGLQYVYNGNVFSNIYHQGNHRSDSQNDSRYVNVSGDTMTGSLTVTSTITANGFYESSDVRLKDNIAPLNYGLKEIEKLDTHTWNWKSDGSEDMGLIAQELELIMPELVKTDEDGYKSVNYSKLIPVLINAIKELSNGKKS